LQPPQFRLRLGKAREKYHGNIGGFRYAPQLFKGFIPFIKGILISSRIISGKKPCSKREIASPPDFAKLTSYCSAKSSCAIFKSAVSSSITSTVFFPSMPVL
jgi:hypothetical protein